jgi:hypothetical protein
MRRRYWYLMKAAQEAPGCTRAPIVGMWYCFVALAVGIGAVLIAAMLVALGS